MRRGLPRGVVPAQRTEQQIRPSSGRIDHLEQLQGHGVIGHGQGEPLVDWRFRTRLDPGEAPVQLRRRTHGGDGTAGRGGPGGPGVLAFPAREGSRQFVVVQVGSSFACGVGDGLVCGVGEVSESVAVVRLHRGAVPPL